MKYPLLLIFIWFNNNLYSQNWNRYWCFGDSAAIDFTDLRNPIPTISFMDCSMSSTSAGDSLGDLLMYAHSQYLPQFIQGNSRATAIHNKYHSLMEKGDSLVGTYYNGLVFIPNPGNDSLFYLFQFGSNPDDGICYSIIEPHYNNDSGRVIIRNHFLPIANQKLMSSIIAVKHGNGRDWWIILRSGNYNSNTFIKYLLTPYSVLGPYGQQIGTITSLNTGLTSISKNGNKIALTISNGISEVYDFDRCSGVFSNTRTFITQPTIHLFGCEFSPNGQFLYVSNTNSLHDTLRLYQYNLNDSNSSNSLFKVYEEVLPVSGGMLKCGPDNKIYFSCVPSGWPYSDTTRNLYNENLSVINSPDSLGTACNFQPFSFYLGGKRTYWSLPNIPNYILGPVHGSSCDSLSSTFKAIENNISIFPNPTSNKCYVDISLSNINVTIYNALGDFLKDQSLTKNINEIDLSGNTNGIYILKFSCGITKLVVKSE